MAVAGTHNQSIGIFFSNKELGFEQQSHAFINCLFNAIYHHRIHRECNKYC
jgi:hypothetical protein